MSSYPNPYQPPSPEQPVYYGGPPPTPPIKDQRPGKVQAIAIMTLIGGIYATILGAGMALYVILNSVLMGVASMGIGCVGLLCLPLPAYSVTIGILAIVKGAKLLGQNARWETPPRTIAILQIINIISCDVPNLVLGILELVFLDDPEVQAWYQGP